MPNEEARKKYRSCDLVIVPKRSFDVASAFPFEVDGALKPRLMKVLEQYLIHPALKELSLLASRSSIECYESKASAQEGSRSTERSLFDKSFLVPFGIDCTHFEFVYQRLLVRPQLIQLNLLDSGESVFASDEERGVFFVGKNETGKEDSCIDSICRHVRNSFAHGRAAVKPLGDDALLFLEDGAAPRDVDYEGNKPEGLKLEIRARAVVKLSTLEQWAKVLFNEG